MRNWTVCAARARSDSASETLKRRRSRLMSTSVASTSPVLTNWPVSTVRVLTIPASGGRTLARATFWAAMSRAALADCASASRRSVSWRARFSSSTATSCSLGQLLAPGQVGGGPPGVGQGLLVVRVRAHQLQAVPFGVDAQRAPCPGSTRSPSWKRTSVTAPSTSAVIWTSSSASSVPGGLDLVDHVLDRHRRHAHGQGPGPRPRRGRGALAAAAGRGQDGQDRRAGERGKSGRRGFRTSCGFPYCQGAQPGLQATRGQSAVKRCYRNTRPTGAALTATAVRH